MTWRVYFSPSTPPKGWHITSFQLSTQSELLHPMDNFCDHFIVTKFVLNCFILEGWPLLFHWHLPSIYMLHIVRDRNKQKRGLLNLEINEVLIFYNSCLRSRTLHEFGIEVESRGLEQNRPIQPQGPLGNMSSLAQSRCYPGIPPPHPRSSVNEPNQCPFVPSPPLLFPAFISLVCTDCLFFIWTYHVFFLLIHSVFHSLQEFAILHSQQLTQIQSIPMNSVQFIYLSNLYLTRKSLEINLFFEGDLAKRHIDTTNKINLHTSKIS